MKNILIIEVGPLGAPRLLLIYNKHDYSHPVPMSGDFQLRPGGFGFLLFQVCETQLYTNTDTTIQLKSERNLTLWLLEMRNLELSLFAI